MTKSIFTFITFLIIKTVCYSQDIIIKKTGEEFQSKILEITQTAVKYRKIDNLDGPIFTTSKSEILMIRYENGNKEIFNQADTKIDDKQNSNHSLAMQGKNDAISNYRGKNSGSGLIIATTILFTPLIGVIPAAICSATEPSGKNLNYPDAELMKNYDYNHAYIEQAHRKKKGKVWRNFGISSGIWLILVSL